jgi:hypothetical protein
MAEGGGGGQPFPPYSLNDPPRREAQQPQNAANPIRAQEMICLVVFFGRARERHKWVETCQLPETEKDTRFGGKEFQERRIFENSQEEFQELITIMTFQKRCAIFCQFFYEKISRKSLP